jgi:phosphomannomutase
VATALDALVDASELAIADERVTAVIDYRRGSSERAPWLGSAELVELQLASGARLFVRPSGTEPKLKLYGHVRREITLRSDFSSALVAAHNSAAALLQRLLRALQL